MAISKLSIPDGMAPIQLVVACWVKGFGLSPKTFDPKLL